MGEDRCAEAIKRDRRLQGNTAAWGPELQPNDAGTVFQGFGTEGGKERKLERGIAFRKLKNNGEGRRKTRGSAQEAGLHSLLSRDVKPKLAEEGKKQAYSLTRGRRTNGGKRVRELIQTERSNPESA